MVNWDRINSGRIYNGCPDSSIQRQWDEEDRLVREMKALLPTAGVTYYPMGEFWVAWDRGDGYRPIVDMEFPTKASAVRAAITKLKEQS